MSNHLKTFDAFVAAAHPSINSILQFTSDNHLEHLVADHICYKCGSADEYNELRSMLESSQQYRYMHQSIISGRRVAYFKFEKGFPVGESMISYLELSDVKPGEDETTGFHHVELYPVSRSLHEFIQALNGKQVTGELKVRPHHTTYDVILANGFIARFCDGPLIQKIAEEILL